MAASGMQDAYGLALVVMSLAWAMCLVGCTGSEPGVRVPTEFVVPPGVDPALLNGSFFAVRGLRLNQTQPLISAKESEAQRSLDPDESEAEYASLEFPPHTLSPPHSHPGHHEVLAMGEGSLRVGFVGTTNLVFEDILEEGDVFVFPKGVLHFQSTPPPSPPWPSPCSPSVASRKAPSAPSSPTPAPAPRERVSSSPFVPGGYKFMVPEKAFKVSKADIIRQYELIVEELMPTAHLPTCGPNESSVHQYGPGIDDGCFTCQPADIAA